MAVKKLTSEYTLTDWKITTFGNEAPLQRGYDLPINKIEQGNYPVVFSNGINYYNNVFKINGPGVITGRSGTIGSVFYVEENYWPHNTTLYVVDFKGNVPKFIYYLYSYHNLNELSSGSGVPTLNRNEIHPKKIVIPPIEEQAAIATALSDIDSLITSLEQLIEKKRLVKQGAMQELLTGKKRLPGFEGSYKLTDIGEIPEDWEVKSLGQLFDIYAAGDLKFSNYSKLKISPFIYPVYANSTIDNGLYGYSSEYDIDAPSITITARGNIGCAVPRFSKFCAIGRLLVLIPKIDLYILFVSSYINGFVNFVQETTGVPQLTVPQASNYIVPIPPIEEQAAIASVLSDMDEEIAALEAKLEKTRKIKEGMMAELLSGRTRLV